MAINKETKQKLISEFGKNAKDTGNVEVQIAILTKEISQLTEHLKVHKKDFHSKLGLFKKISYRHSLLFYLKKDDNKRYLSLIKKLNLKA